MNPTSGRQALVAVLAAIPWLVPFTFGPSPNMLPWLASAFCAATLWLVAPQALRVPRYLALGAAALVLVSWAMHPAIQQPLLALAGGLALVVLGASLAQGNADAHWLEMGILVAAVISALIGLCQYLGAAGALAPWADAAPIGEAFGNLRQANQFATLCWLGTAILLFGTQRQGVVVKAGVIAILAAASCASTSRTGILEGLSLIALALIWPSPDRAARLRLCAVAAIAFAVASIALPHLLHALTDTMPARTFWNRLGGTQDCNSRTVLWGNVLELIRLSPFRGWGWGELDYAHFMTLYPGPRFCEILDNAHNLPLHVAVELGLPAALAAGGGALWWVWRQHPWHELDATRQLAWAGLAVLTIHSMLEYPLWYGPFQIAAGVFLGRLRICRTWSVAPARGRLAACFTLLLLALVVWSYWLVSQVYLTPTQRAANWRDDPLAAARQSWLFADQARFAELTLGTVTRDNATLMLEDARASLHYSPEPRVIERAIEAAAMLNRDDEAMALLARYRAAFPAESQEWSARNRGR